MGKRSKRKGSRRELEFAKLIGGKRIPLSGAVDGYTNDVEGMGLKWEVKARKDGFKQLYKWIEDEREQPDALALKADRKQWLVVLPLDTFKNYVNGLVFDGEELSIIRELLSEHACGYEREDYYFHCCDAAEIVRKIDKYWELMGDE